jgi:hypothetical protein
MMWAMAPGFKILFGLGGLMVVFTGMWAVTHSNGETIRFAGGIGSSLSPGARRFWGMVVAILGAAMVVSAALV